MIPDRFGKPVFVAWADYQLLWIEAAISLDRPPRMAAFLDIAALTGRSLQAVKTKAREIRARQKHGPSPYRVAVTPREPRVRDFPLTEARLAPTWDQAPEGFKWPTREQMMSGRVSRQKPVATIEAAE